MKRCKTVITLGGLAIILGAVNLTSCTKVEATTLENVRGTYILKSHTRNYTGGASYDYMVDYDEYAYLVVGDEGKGMMVHGDKTFGKFATSINYTITYDDGDNSDLVKSIVVEDAQETPFRLYVNGGKKTLANNESGLKNDLSINYYQNFVFEKVSDTYDLSYFASINYDIGKVLSASEFLLHKRLFVLNEPDSSNLKYNYSIVDLNMNTMTADRYYQEVGSEKVENLSIPFTIEDKVISLGEETYYWYPTDECLYLDSSHDANKGYFNSWRNFSITSINGMRTIQEAIVEKTA